jgi:hypothetical protein
MKQEVGVASKYGGYGFKKFGMQFVRESLRTCNHLPQLSLWLITNWVLGFSFWFSFEEMGVRCQFYGTSEMRR